MLVDPSVFMPAVVLLASSLLPVLLAVGVATYLKRVEAREERRAPIKEKLLHQAGAQARKRAEDAGDEVSARIAMLMLVGPFVLLCILLPRVRWSALRFGWLEWGMIGGAALGIVFILRDLLRFRRERRAWLDGMRGEMATAQELDRLRMRGCEVFHDVPFERGNIDHVVVAPAGVFAVETKWRSKRGKGSASAEVWFDGKALEFPGGRRDALPVEQATACARELSRYLGGTTGEPVSVVPVVALPGWFAKDRPGAGAGIARVVNPKMAGALLNTAAPPMAPAQRRRIVHAISERYPVLDA